MPDPRDTRDEPIRVVLEAALMEAWRNHPTDQPKDRGGPTEVYFSAQKAAMALVPVVRGLVEPQHIDVEEMRASLHATFNGGHRTRETREAFHHGMDTVCNVLASHQRGENSNGILPLPAPPEP